MHRASRSVVSRRPPIRHPLSVCRLTGTGIYPPSRNIKSAIVSPLNELSHAYAYSRSSSNPLLGCACARPVRCTLHARISRVQHTHSYVHVCAWCTLGAWNMRARCVRSRARRSRFQEVQGSIEVRPVDPGTYSPHPHTDA